MAQRLQQKKQQTTAEPSREATQNAEREKKLLEQERAKAEEEAKKVAEVEEDDGAAGEASEDSASYKSEGEDLNKLPQERPKVIRYTKEMILNFVKKESKKTFEDDYRFENLIREIQKFNRKDHPNMFPSGGSKGGNFRDRDRGGDSRSNYSNSTRGSNYSKYSDPKRGGRQDNYNNKDSKWGYSGAGGSKRDEPQQGTLFRNKITDEQAQKLKELRADDDWSQRNKGIASEEEALKREINLKLF